MYEAKSRDMWNHTAAIMAAAMQPHSKREIDPNRLNPWNQRRKADATVTVGELQALLGMVK